MSSNQLTSKFALSGRMIDKLLLGVCILLCFGIAFVVLKAVFYSSTIGSSIGESISFLNKQNDRSKTTLEEHAAQVNKLKEKGMFLEKKNKPKPPAVTGILGDSVLLSGKWCKVNDEHAGAKVLKIEPTEVTILWEGEEKKLSPLLARTVENPGDEPKKESAGKKKEKVVQEDSQAPPAQPEGEQIVDDPLAWLGVNLSPEQRSFLTKYFALMSDEELDQMKSEWAKMSDEDKQEAMDQMQQMIDSGQADAMLESVKQQKGL